MCRVNGAQLKALQGARLPETEEEWQHVKGTLDTLQAWLKDETTPDLFLQDLRGLANFIYGWWDTRNKREGGYCCLYGRQQRIPILGDHTFCASQESNGYLCLADYL